eukprot:6135825-Amphidinium_carterae.1
MTPYCPDPKSVGDTSAAKVCDHASPSRPLLIAPHHEGRNAAKRITLAQAIHRLFTLQTCHRCLSTPSYVALVPRAALQCKPESRCGRSPFNDFDTPQYVASQAQQHDHSRSGYYPDLIVSR